MVAFTQIFAVCAAWGFILSFTVFCVQPLSDCHVGILAIGKKFPGVFCDTKAELGFRDWQWGPQGQGLSEVIIKWLLVTLFIQARRACRLGLRSLLKDDMCSNLFEMFFSLGQGEGWRDTVPSWCTFNRNTLVKTKRALPLPLWQQHPNPLTKAAALTSALLLSA